MWQVTGRVIIGCSSPCRRQSANETTSPLALQDLVEKVVVLKKAVERKRRKHTAPTHPFFEEKLWWVKQDTHQ